MVKSILFFLMLFLLLFNSCSDTKLKPLVIAHNEWIGYQPLQIALHENLLHKNIKLLELPNSTEAMRMFRNKLIDGLALTLDEAILLEQETNDVSIVLLIDYSNGADALLAHETIKDLKDKKIGFESNAVGAVMLHSILRQNGLALEDIIPIKLDAHQHLLAFQNRQVDAIITFEPMKSKIEALGGKILFDSSAIKGSIMDVLVIRKSSVPTYKDTVSQLLDGWFKALPLVKGNIFLSQKMGLSPKELDKLYSGIQLLNKGDNQKVLLEQNVFETKITELIQSMQEAELIHHVPTVSALDMIPLQMLKAYYE